MKYFSSSILLLLTGFYLFFPAAAFAQCPPGYESLCDIGPDTNPNLFGNIIQFIIIIAIIVSMIFIAWGGIKWASSSGDKEKVAKARSTIIAAIIGLIISVLAYALVSYVVYLFTGSSDLNFALPRLID